MVWIHGGGYVIGMSGLPEYDGGRLARDGGVVVVTFNYRVGIEGFAQIEGAPANRGLLDQVAALEWVRDNIRAFGGDPDRVTVFGQSAGGGSVAALLAMPRAAGLFRRAVAQSMPGTFFSPELAADIAGVLAAELGLHPTDLSTVAPGALPAVGDAVMAKIGQCADRWGLAAHRTIPFAPVVDGDAPHRPWQALADGAARDVDLLVGHTRDEQRLFTLIDGTLGQVTEEQAATALNLFAPGPDGAARYRAAGRQPGGAVRAGPLRLAVPHAVAAPRRGAHRPDLRVRADLARAGHGRRPRRLPRPRRAARLRQPDQRPARHADRRRPDRGGDRVRADARARGRRSPPTATPAGPRTTASERLTQLFDTEPAVVPYPEEVSRRIWQDHVFSVLPLIGRV